MVTKTKKPSKKVVVSHDKARGEIVKMANHHNNKVIGVGTQKIFADGIYTLYDVGVSSQLKEHADVMQELGRIESYRITKNGKYGDELWVR
jgi:hypothetical protein